MAASIDDFALHRARLSTGADIAYAREGTGGVPLLLVHGWPETRRIWWHNIAPLAAAGFEVIAPDLRGFGDSGLAPDDRYDPAAHARDMEALVCGALGHSACVVSAGDLGGVVAQDLSLRFGGLVERMILFNTIAPFLPAEYEAAGLGATPPVSRQSADYFARQSRDADGLAAELDTPQRRRSYVTQMYGPRLWAGPGAFSADDIDFLAEPFGDADHFRASIANYEYVGGARTAPEPPRMLERNPTSTLVLYGPEDHVIPSDFPQRMEVAFPRDRRPVGGRRRGPLPDVGAPACIQPCTRALLPGPPGTITPTMSAQRPSASELAARQVEQIVAAAQAAADEIKAEAAEERKEQREQGKRDAERVIQKARDQGEAELNESRKSAVMLGQDARREVEATLTDAKEESEKVREQTRRAVEGRVASAEKAASQVLEEAQALSGGLRQLGRALEDHAEKILHDVQAAHKRMQADLRVESGGGASPPPASRPRQPEPAPARRRSTPVDGAQESRQSRSPRERPNPFEDLDVPRWSRDK